MKKINLWSIERDEAGVQSARLVQGLENSETEEQLESLLVASPELLMPNLVLVGRQIPTAGGPLDLLGIDQEGRTVVFELKRGILTREAVAQVLDYASDLAERGLDHFAKLVEKHSGQRAIESIEDFMDWYDQQFPDSDDPLEDGPRMMLVGLGVDDRARRVVDFLAGAGVDLQLLTFHAFEVEGKLLLARQVESRAAAQRGDQTKTQKKVENQKILLQSADQLGVKDFLAEVANFVDARLPAYRWPGKTGYTFSLPYKTSEGRPTSRSYVALFLKDKKPGSLLIQVAPNSMEVAEEAVRNFADAVPAAELVDKSYSALDAEITSADWARIQEPFDELLHGIEAGWKAMVTQQGENTEE